MSTTKTALTLFAAIVLMAGAGSAQAACNAKAANCGAPVQVGKATPAPAYVKAMNNKTTTASAPTYNQKEFPRQYVTKPEQNLTPYASRSNDFNYHNTRGTDPRGAAAFYGQGAGYAQQAQQAKQATQATQARNTVQPRLGVNDVYGANKNAPIYQGYPGNGTGMASAAPAKPQNFGPGGSTITPANNWIAGNPSPSYYPPQNFGPGGPTITPANNWIAGNPSPSYYPPQNFGPGGPTITCPNKFICG